MEPAPTARQYLSSALFLMAAGWGGLILGIVGSLGLLYRRWTDPELGNYSSPVDYFNLLFILIFFISGLRHLMSASSRSFRMYFSNSASRF